MVILGDNAEIRLEFIETMPENVPCTTDVCCCVTASSQGFSGCANRVWFSRDGIERFLADLKQLNAVRQGEAVLTDYSFGSEFAGVRISLFSIDGWGHIGARAEITVYRPIGNLAGKQAVAVEFETYADRFAEVVDTITALLAPH